ncbi:MAG: hypothetical protein JNM20_13500 [Rhizobiales bacterium]|nr:hypothetical protein [Hyphomicrobiales bacterium]
MLTLSRAAHFGFSSNWLMAVGLRQLPILLAIFALQFAYRIDPESATSPVALYVLINLIAVAGLGAFISYSGAYGRETGRCLAVAAAGFLLLVGNEFLTWSSETLAEDLCVLGVWIVTGIAIFLAIARLTRADAAKAILAVAVVLQFLALATDLADDGPLAANTPDDWLSWTYALASVASITACQMAFLYLAMRPAKASHGWEVSARVGPSNMKQFFDVGVADADEAVAAVERLAGTDLRKIRAVAPIPATSFHALGLDAGEVRPR